MIRQQSNLAAVLLLVLSGVTGILAACGDAPPDPPADTAGSTADPYGTISRDGVDRDIRVLSADSLLGRDPFTPSIRMAEDYIAERFREAGLAEFPGMPDYRDDFTFEYRSRRNPDAPPVTYELTNVVGYLEGTDPELKKEFILVGAHHDHVGVRSREGDSIFNGADDNATGTTAVIALARYFGEARINKRSLVFATFTAEERGLVGSRHLAQELPVDSSQLLCMINFEMIGKPAEDGDFELMMLGPAHSTLDEIFRSALDPDSPITLVDPLEHQVRYFRASDNRAFTARGFITATLASPLSTDDPVYHTPEDEYRLLDIDYMTAAIRATADMLEPLVTGEATPERTEPQDAGAGR